MNIYFIYKSGFELAVQKFETFSSNPVKLHSEGLVHLLRNIWYNNYLGYMFYFKIENTPLSDLLIQDSIKSEINVVVLSDSIYKHCPDTVIIKGAYILFYQVYQSIIAHMFQVQFPNLVLKVGII